MFTTSGFCNLPGFSSVMIPEPWEEGCHTGVLLRNDYSMHVDWLWVCGHCHLLQEDASPIEVEVYYSI